MSIAGVKPSAHITWFQAQQACANAGKRLLRNGEWQMGGRGHTPDPGTDNDSTDCNITNDGFPANDPVNTGSRSACVSRWGVFDMMGNVWEWVEDWAPLSTACVGELFGGTEDFNCLAGASTSAGPGALFRGGDFVIGAFAGVFGRGRGRSAVVRRLQRWLPLCALVVLLWLFGILDFECERAAVAARSLRRREQWRSL